MARLVEDAMHRPATASKVEGIVNAAKAPEYHEEDFHRQSAQRIHLSRRGTGPIFEIMWELLMATTSPMPLNCKPGDNLCP